MKRKLTRSKDSVIGGVLGGISEYYDIGDPWVIRIAYIVLWSFSIGIPFSLIYLILWITIPEKEDE